MKQHQLFLRHQFSLAILIVSWCTVRAHGGENATTRSVKPGTVDIKFSLTITSSLPEGRIPFDPTIDFGKIISDVGASGVFDPNSIKVVNVATGRSVDFGRTEHFAYGDRGPLEWVIVDASHTNYEISFRTVAERPELRPQAYVPMVGVGDLLRYNAGEPRPIALPYLSRLVDLTGDGKPDLIGCWNYAYRPGWPWDGIIFYPGIVDRMLDSHRMDFGDLTRIRFVDKTGSTTFRHFEGTYMWADFADFDGDRLIDILWCPASDDRIHFYRNTGRRDAGGMPVFTASGSIPRQTKDWEFSRAVDLDQDGAIDVTVGDFWLRNLTPGQIPPKAAPAVKLNLPGTSCWFDVDRDGRLDAVVRTEIASPGLSNYRLEWRRNQGGRPPSFEEALPLSDINSLVEHPIGATTVDDGRHSGLLLTQNPNQTTLFCEQTGPGRFRSAATALSKSAVISLGDQAWPNFCDWDGDGDLDLLVGGGYGWLQIVLNGGSADRPSWNAPRFVLAENKPIRLTRNEILGGDNWHDMGYSYSAYIDWDGDRLPDLLLPNETNRIFWYRNIGTRSRPSFGPRLQIICDGFPDNEELRHQSAARADDPKSNNGVYPYEADQPFFWRTGAAFADWNSDGLMDFITHDGHTRVATLFVQKRDSAGRLHLRKERALSLSDGRPINDAIIGRNAHWTESFRAVDWDRDGLQDLLYSLSGGKGAGSLEGGSIYLLKNVGSKMEPSFSPPTVMRSFGTPIQVTNHGPHPWAGDLDGDGLPDLVACVEWSVYPFYSHHALQMPRPPTFHLADPRIIQPNK